MQIGDRITIKDALVKSVYDYKGRNFITGAVQFFWLVTLVDSDGNHFKYSTSNNRVRIGEILTIKGTVKKFDNRFNYIKLNRVSIVERHSSL